MGVGVWVEVAVNVGELVKVRVGVAVEVFVRDGRGVKVGVNVEVEVGVFGKPVGMGSFGERNVAQASVAKTNIITNNPAE